MQGVRHIVVDCHSVIFHLPALRGLHATKPAAARQRLIAALVHLQDYSGLRVHAVFDGRLGNSGREDDAGIEIRYASAGQTADSIIERAVGAASRPELIAVVTADHAEGTTISALGAQWWEPEQLNLLFSEYCPEWVLQKLHDPAN